MPAHADILDQPDSLNKPLLGSVALHAAVFGTLLLWGAVLSTHHETWGDANSGGPGSIAINVVNKIPLPSRSGTRQPAGQRYRIGGADASPRCQAEEAGARRGTGRHSHQEPHASQAVSSGHARRRTPGAPNSRIIPTSFIARPARPWFRPWWGRSGLAESAWGWDRHSATGLETM